MWNDEVTNTEGTGFDQTNDPGVTVQDGSFGQTADPGVTVQDGGFGQTADSGSTVQGTGFGMSKSGKRKTDTTIGMEVGSVLRERYRLGSIMGVGGFGITYAAEDLMLERKVAIKEYYPMGIVARNSDKSVQVISEYYADSFAHGIDRFLQEARDVAKFSNNPNVVSVTDFFRENGTAYMVMEYLNGRTLKEYLDENMKEQGGISGDPMVLRVSYAMMKILSEVHEAGIVHRDIAPDNIFVCDDSTIKLLDFGAAKTYGEEMGTASVVMKQGYTPVEQYSRDGKIGPWTDVYAFGAMLYYMVTGTRPQESIDRLMEDKLVEPKILNPDVSDHMNHVILKAMAIRWEDRYRDMGELRADFNNPAQTNPTVTNQPVQVSPAVTSQSVQMNPVVTNQPVQVNPGVANQPVQGATKKKAGIKKKILITSAALLLAAGIFCIIYFAFIRQDPKQETTARGQEGTTAGEPEGTTEVPAGTTEYILLNGKETPIAGKGVAEDCFFCNYKSTESTSSGLPYEASVRKQFSYSLIIDGKKYSELPLAVRFGRGFGRDADEFSRVESYRNSDNSAKYYTANLSFVQKDSSTIGGKPGVRLCVYSIDGNVIHFQGITPSGDSYKTNDFSIDLEYEFNGFTLTLSKDGMKVDMNPEEFYNRETMLEPLYNLRASVSSEDQIFKDLVAVDKEKGEESAEVIFKDDSRAVNPEIDIYDDGTFRMAWAQRSTKFDGKDKRYLSQEDIKGVLIGYQDTGAVFAIDGKVYLYLNKNPIVGYLDFIEK